MDFKVTRYTEMKDIRLVNLSELYRYDIYSRDKWLINLYMDYLIDFVKDTNIPGYNAVGLVPFG